MKKLILTITTCTILLISCNEKINDPSNATTNDSKSSLISTNSHQKLADNRFQALNDNNIAISRIIFKGYTPDVKAAFWKFKLESWRDNVNTPQVEKDAINKLLPKVTEQLFTVNESDKVYLDFINYIENDWLKTIQPYINYERLMLLIASPYYPETPNSSIVIGSGGSGGSEKDDCECNLSRSSDFCNGVPGSPGGGAAKHCVQTNNCYATAHGCGWLLIMTCRGECQ